MLCIRWKGNVATDEPESDGKRLPHRSSSVLGRRRDHLLCYAQCTILFPSTLDNGEFATASLRRRSFLNTTTGDDPRENSSTRQCGQNPSLQALNKLGGYAYVPLSLEV